MKRLLTLVTAIMALLLMAACSTPTPYDPQPARNRADRAQQEMSTDMNR